jgi:large repetitive protein
MSLTVIVDTFTDADNTNLTAHTPDTDLPGSAWTVPNGAWQILTNQASINAVSGGDQFGIIDATGTPSNLQLDVIIPAAFGGTNYAYAAGIVFRYSDVNNWWAFGIQNPQPPAAWASQGPAQYSVFLAKVVGGAATYTFFETGLSLVSTTQTLKVAISGNTFTCSRGATNYTPIADSGTILNPLSTKCGFFGFHNGSGNGFYSAIDTLDNFSAALTLAILPATLPTGQLGTSYSQTLTTTGQSSTGPVTWAVTSGSLPPGLVLNASTGVISGTFNPPSTAFTITVTDNLGNTATATYTIPVAGKIFLVCPDPEPGTERTRKFEQQVAAILNGLLMSGAIVPGSGGSFVMAGLTIGQSITASDANSFLVVGPSNTLQDTGTAATFVQSTGLATFGQLSIGTLFVSSQIFMTPDGGVTVGFKLNYFLNVTGYTTVFNCYPDATCDGIQIGNQTSTGLSTLNIAQAGAVTTTIPFRVTDNLGTTNQVWVTGKGELAVQIATATAFCVGRQGQTNPALQVDSSTALSVTGINVKSAASGGGVAMTAISSGANENFTIDSKGSGTITIGPSGTSTIIGGAFSVVNGPAFSKTVFSVVSGGGGGTANQTGIAITGATAAIAQVNLAAITTATNCQLNIRAVGNGGVVLGLVGGGGVGVNGGMAVTGNVGFNNVGAQAVQTGDVATALVTYGLMTSPTYAGTSVGAPANAYVVNDVTTTSSAMANVTGLSFAIPANTVWSVEFNLLSTGSLGGVVFQLTGPAAPTLVTIFTQGDTTGVTGVSSDSQSAFGTPTQAYIVNVVPFTGVVTMKALISNGANAGTVRLQFASATNTQTNIIKAGSYMTARRVV